MKIYDISQEVFGSAVYPGDPSPERKVISSMERGDLYRLTAFSMCAHNGTHIDAPAHFIRNGKTVEQLSLPKLIGEAYVAPFDGILDAKAAEKIYRKAQSANAACAKRILLKGRAVVSSEAARFFAKQKLDLLGVESQTVGPEDAPMEVHLILLGAETVLLEGVRLGGVAEGVYLLHAAPLSLAGSDGAPCRATLTEF